MKIEISNKLGRKAKFVIEDGDDSLLVNTIKTITKNNPFVKMVRTSRYPSLFSKRI